MSNPLPPIGTVGIFELQLPYVLVPNKSYKVHAHRTFDEMIATGDDPLATCYTPYGLDITAYEADKLAGAVVITLMATGVDPIHVPNTKIVKYPDTGVVPHSWFVASVSCGILPDNYDTGRLIEAIQTTVKLYTGVESEVKVAVMPTSTAVTQQQYEEATNIRNQAIENLETDYSSALGLKIQVESLKQQNSDLIAIIEQLQQ